MKFFAFALAFLAATSHAGVIAYLPNPNGEGGLIELSDVRCADGGYQAFIVQPDGLVRDTGCWRVDGDLAAVQWSSDYGTMYYRLDSLNLVKAKKKTKPASMM